MIDDSVNLGVENERADAGRDGQTRLARPNSRARAETGKNPITVPCAATRDGTAKPVSRDQILGRERRQGKIRLLYPVQLTPRKIGHQTG